MKRTEIVLMQKSHTKLFFLILLVFNLFSFASPAHAYDEAVLIRAAKKRGIPQKQIDKMTGYIQKYYDSIPNKNYVTFVDFKQSSANERGYLINTDTGAVQTFLVAHGKKSGKGKYATSFSNVVGSNKSSLGLYYVKNSYSGEFGYSVRVSGLENSNNNAEQRAIVIHPFTSVSESFIGLTGKIGTTEGCFGLNKKNSEDLINKVKGGSLWLAYY